MVNWKNCQECLHRSWGLCNNHLSEYREQIGACTDEECQHCVEDQRRVMRYDHTVNRDKRIFLESERDSKEYISVGDLSQLINADNNVIRGYSHPAATKDQERVADLRRSIVELKEYAEEQQGIYPPKTTMRARWGEVVEHCLAALEKNNTI